MARPGLLAQLPPSPVLLGFGGSLVRPGLQDLLGPLARQEMRGLLVREASSASLVRPVPLGRRVLRGAPDPRVRSDLPGLLDLQAPEALQVTPGQLGLRALPGQQG